MHCNQGDQMSLRKNVPKMEHPLPKLIHNFYRGKKFPEIRANADIFKKLPKVNNRTLGEKSYNLVTLIDPFVVT
jgi:hypothetical protein